MRNADPAPAKILVVDDEPAMVGALGALLGQAGHRIIAAYDGDEALRRFRDDEPDLVLLDLAMPGMDGATVCRRIREMSDTPVIVVSGERDRAATVELLDLGADDYVRKPFRADELLARVRAVSRRSTPGRSARGRPRRHPPRLRVTHSHETLRVNGVGSCHVEQSFSPCCGSISWLS